MTRRNIIEVKDLSKLYKYKGGEKKAIDTVSFSVKEGEVFGILGPNGAGKTTTIKILTTLLLPSSGTATVLGYDVSSESHKIRDKINFVFGGEKGVYGRLTATEYLYYFCTLYKIPKKRQSDLIAELLETVGLQETGKQKTHTFSKGMIQRLHIARCLINSPKLLFLDEPTIGLDPVGAQLLRNLVRELAGKGITIILTTHYMQEADELCDRIAFIKNGTLSLVGKPEEIKNSCNHLQLFEAIISIVNLEGLKADKKFSNIEADEIKWPFHSVRFELNNELDASSLQTYLSQYGEVLKIQRKPISLEDAYIYYMNDVGEEG